MSVLDAFIQNFRTGFAKNGAVDSQQMYLNEFVNGILDLIDYPASITVYVQGDRSEYGYVISRDYQVASKSVTVNNVSVVVEIYSYKYPRTAHR